MKIRSLHLKNVGVFDDETISFPEKQDKDLSEIHILTGENGTGKTTILQALARVTARYPFINNCETKTSYNLRKRFQQKKEVSQFIVTLDNDNSITVDKLDKPIDEIGNPIVQLVNKDQEKKGKYKFRDYVHSHSAFAYSGNRFIRHEENINIRENASYNPLENALEFDKEYGSNDYSLNQWLANTISKRNNAFFEGIEEEVNRFKKNIDFFKEVIEKIVGYPIYFKFKNETSKIVVVKNGQALDFDLLPDGLRSIISWLGDLIMRMDAIKWENDLDIRDREFILFLDEIEVHLHPKWQRKILPVVQELFKNAQIFITTHSPFIVNSVDGAWIYDLELNNNSVTCKKPILSKASNSINYVLRKIFDVPELYGKPVQDKLDKFYEYRTEIMEGNLKNKQPLLDIASDLIKLKDRTIEDRIYFELEQLGTEYAI